MKQNPKPLLQTLQITSIGTLGRGAFAFSPPEHGRRDPSNRGKLPGNPDEATRLGKAASVPFSTTQQTEPWQ